MPRRYIKCIITRDCTFILDADQVGVQAFVHQLQLKAAEKPDPREGGLEAPLLDCNSPLQAPGGTLPHELRVLEAALDNVNPPFAYPEL